ncbi:MAG: PAS domain S-box protein, partial [Cyclobacteriaceae bacterium]|nr:PAS domain S-box protein [Cyclobacteriaceae bacterium]
MSSTKNLNTLKATFEVCKDPMALVNSQEEITLFNSAFVELFNLPSTREQYSIQNIKHSLFLKKETLIENPYALFKSLSKTNSQEAGVYVQIKKDFTFFLLKSVEIQDPETADSEYLITFQQNNTLDNHHYLDVLESSPAGTWLWDISSGKVTWWGNIEEMFGLKKGEFDGTYEHFKALIYKEDLPEVEKSIAQSLKTGNNYSAIHRVQLKNKEIRWLQENGRIIKGTDGKPEKIAGFVTDITIQKQLQDDRNRYDSFVKYSTGCKFITDLDGKIIFVNDFCRYLLGIQGDSIHGESLELLIAEEYQKNYINIILPAILKDGKWNGELSIQHQTEKTTIPVIFDSFLIFNEKNKPYNIGFSAKDISREVELRKNLLSSQALFESIFKNSIDVILTIDRNFIVNTINRPLGQFSTNEINNNLVLDFLPQDQKDNIKQYLKDCFQSGTLKSFDFEYKLKSNTLIYAATIIPMQKNNQIDSLMIVLRDQTQQKIREIELSKATNAIESSMDAIFSSDLEGLITYANPAAAEKWGYRNVSEMLAERPYVFNYWKEESLPLAQEIMQTLGEEGKYEGEGQLVATKKNGEEFVVRIRSRLIQDKNGNPIGMTGSFHNLSELIKINQELSIKEHELKEAQRIAKIGSWELDLVNNVLHWSDEIYRLLGLEPQSINANFETFLGYIHPDEREIVANAYTSHVEHKTEYDIIHRLISEDKKVYYIHERCETLYDDEGTPLRSLGTAADVTELKEIQIELELLKENLEKIVTERTSELEQINEELEVANSELVSIHTSIIKQEEKYRILAENSGDAVSSYDANLNCTYVSPAIQRITGYTPQESLALSLKDIVHPLDYEKVYLSFQKGLKREENKTTTRYRRKNKDGTFSWMESLATYNFTANNQLENIIVNERDISSQIHIENELRESEERFRGIFENAGTGVVFGDEQGNTILVNEAFENIIGYSHDELYKLNFRD